jgi:hypothetical protein
MDWHKLKIAYLHGRPGPHWHEQGLCLRPSAPSFTSLTSLLGGMTSPSLPGNDTGRWLQNALALPLRAALTLIFVDGPHVWPPIGKLLRSHSDPPYPSGMRNETLYFLYCEGIYHPIGWKARLDDVCSLPTMTPFIASWANGGENLARGRARSSKCPHRSLPLSFLGFLTRK